MRNIYAGESSRRIAVGVLALAALVAPAPLASASGADRDDRSPVIELPGATGAEGIAAGDGSAFFAGDLLNGNIFRGNIATGTARLFITAPEGRAALGMKVDRDNELLFVAGGDTGQAFTSNNSDVPTTAALLGNTLALVNAKFATPAATSFEAVIVKASSGRD